MSLTYLRIHNNKYIKTHLPRCSTAADVEKLHLVSLSVILRGAALHKMRCIGWSSVAGAAAGKATFSADDVVLCKGVLQGATV